MKWLKFALLTATVLAGAAGSARAQVADYVYVQDDIYGNFNGTVNFGATGSAATLNWYSATYFEQFTLDFTNSAGVISDTLYSNDSDLMEFAAIGSGNAAIGTECVSNATTACVVITGGLQDLGPIIDTVDPYGICCGSSDIEVQIGDSLPVPEPATPAILLTGMAGVAFMRSRRRT